MKTIIDTHALIWAVDDPERLGSKARAIIDDSRNEILFSSGSIWELAIKIGLGKLTLSLPFPTWMNQAVSLFSKLHILFRRAFCKAIEVPGVRIRSSNHYQIYAFAGPER